MITEHTKDSLSKDRDTGSINNMVELLALRKVINAKGETFYYNSDNRLHRIYGPALITSLGTQIWYKDGLKHRTDGPAMIWASGHYECWVGGKLVAHGYREQYKAQHSK